MSSKIYGYARVSTQFQKEDRQLIALKNYGIPENNLIVDKQSGKDFLRPGYKKLLSILNPQDTLVIMSIDRLGRNYDEMIEQWRFLTKKKKVFIVVLDMPILDTRKETDLTGVLISDLVLQLLSYVAQTERDFLRKRVNEGIAVAKSKGVHCGRPALPIPDSFFDVYKLWESHEVSSANAAKMLGVSKNTFLKWANTHRS